MNKKIQSAEPLPASPSLEPTPPSWLALQQATPARIALGRVGASLPTDVVLSLALAHARARDAVHLPLDTAALQHTLAQAGFPSLCVTSQAATRKQYLLRPDLGRRLHPSAHPVLSDPAAPPRRLTLVVADGLSSRAASEHALPMLAALRHQFSAGAWALDTIFLATEARVALGDEIGALRGAEAVLMLIGERPGLSTPSSLGLYLTYAPRPGRTDAERNCLSNIHAGGMRYAEAAFRLHALLVAAQQAGASGIGIKDNSRPPAELSTPHTLAP